MSAVLLHFPIRREKSDADYIRDRITELLTPWQVSDMKIRAAVRYGLNVRRAHRDLDNDAIVKMAVTRTEPTEPTPGKAA